MESQEPYVTMGRIPVGKEEFFHFHAWGLNAGLLNPYGAVMHDYPKKVQEHNALGDAKWNKELYDFLTKNIVGR